MFLSSTFFGRPIFPQIARPGLAFHGGEVVDGEGNRIQANFGLTGWPILYMKICSYIDWPMKDVLRVMKALGDPTRLRIALLLMDHELCVCELMFILKMEQSRISHQLRILRDAGLIEDVRKGRWIIYRIPAPARKMLGSLLGTTFSQELKKSAEVGRDVQQLDVCLREEVRLRRGVPWKRKTLS
jgi:ArsR family transcriptional regulator